MREFKLSTPPLVKRVAAVLHPDAKLLGWALDMLTNIWGLPELVSQPVPFDKTDYYREISPVLYRTFMCFPGLQDAGGLADWKLATHLIEDASAEFHGGVRSVNIDPGWVDGARLILASTKDHAHRIWLRDGIFAEVTMRWQFKRWVSFDYTFPDFRAGLYDKFLSDVRKLWLKQRQAILKKQA